MHEAADSNTLPVHDSDSGKEDNIEPALVYAPAVLENSPFHQVTRNQMDSLNKIIDSKEHLQRNILDFNFGSISSWEMGNQKFEQQIQIILKIKTAKLWENARSYFWKHLWTYS